MIKVFIDGKEGTTGLQLYDRLKEREDIELFSLSEELRKDVNARKAMLNLADVAFLCLPDAAAKDAVGLIENPYTRVVDASTAHRTQSGWAYGFPELDEKHKSDIAAGKRIAVPGCHASGFIALVYPLVKTGIVADDYPFVATSITGYSGGGKKMISEYERGNDPELESPRQYALSQTHKHLAEMTYVTGLRRAPVFEPYVANFYSGMEVCVPVFADLAEKKIGKDYMYDFLSDYYAGSPLIDVEKVNDGFISANAMSGKNDMKIIVGGNDERILLTALFDNLGKGASGAAVECFNIMTGKEESYGLI